MNERQPTETNEKVAPNEGERLVRSSVQSHTPDAFTSREQPQLLTFANEQLQYVRHVAIDAQGDSGLELFLSNEHRKRIRTVGWKDVRTLFEKDIEDLKTDAFGEKSLDPGSNVEGLRRARSINSASGELESLLGVPVAIKGTGTGKHPDEDSAEKLDRQYLHMRYIQLHSLRAPKELRAIIAPCSMYGLIRVPTKKVDGVQQYHEWLIMQRVEGAPLAVKQRRDQSEMDWGDGMIGSMMAPEYFDSMDHQELIAAAKPYLEKPITDNMLYMFAMKKEIPELEAGSVHALQQALGAAGMDGMTDFAGRNILVSINHDGTKRYTIIDQRSG
jgi:hypothetical protein